jgi:hypothetical protein
MCNFAAKKLKIQESSAIMPFSDYSLMACAQPVVGQNDMMKKYGGSNAHR